MSIVIPIENGFAVNVFPLHTEENGWRCRNAGCPCKEDRRPVIALDLRGEDGNIFAVIAHAVRALGEVGQREHVAAIWEGVTASHSYEEAMNLIGEYVKVIDKNAVVKCEVIGCDRMSFNTCTHCGKALCIVHSFGDPAQCVDCFYKH